MGRPRQAGSRVPPGSAPAGEAFRRAVAARHATHVDAEAVAVPEEVVPLVHVGARPLVVHDLRARVSASQ